MPDLVEPLPLGVLADSGELFPSIEDADLDSFIASTSQQLDPSVSGNVLASKAKSDLGTDDSVANPNALAQAGWGVIWGATATQEIKAALAPLLERRRKQTQTDGLPSDADPDPRLYQEFQGPSGYQPNDTAETWLRRQGTSGIPLDDVNPRKGVPYYLLIVAPPTDIPFDFQYDLDLYWAVGRLWFPTAAEFANYAQSVVEIETAASIPTSRQIALFTPDNGKDEAMNLCIQNLANPMLAKTATDNPFGFDRGFQIQSFVGPGATKERLTAILSGNLPGGPPAILFSGSHGMRFRPADSRLPDQQGAIVCADWRGSGSPSPAKYFAGSDLPRQAKIHGMIHVLFDCFGLGWPKKDTFARGRKRPDTVAPEPGLARLPQCLLGHPSGGALAVLGHIDRAWSSSYVDLRGGPRIEGFRSLVTRLTQGHRIGHAADRFNLRRSKIAISLMEQLALEDLADRKLLRNLWIDYDDARNYIVFGDPAVCLRVERMPKLGA